MGGVLKKFAIGAGQASDFVKCHFDRYRSRKESQDHACPERSSSAPLACAGTISLLGAQGKLISIIKPLGDHLKTGHL
jgi:hypothetical protein